MSIRSDVTNSVGGWIEFRTPWGYHRGVVEKVNGRGVLVKVPSEYAPVSLASSGSSANQSDVHRLDAALARNGHFGAGDVTPAFGGYGAGPGYGGPGYGAGAGPGGRWGYPGYGAWGGGWWWWWLAFAWIFAFAFLFW